MAFFIVTVIHPDGEACNKNLKAHVQYLEKLVAEGVLRASGPLKGTAKRSGFLIMSANSKAEIEAVVSEDPFALAGIIETLTIVEWDPLFGAFAAEASDDVAALLAKGID